MLCPPPVVRLLSELLAPGYRLDHSPLMIAMDKVMLTLPLSLTLSLTPSLSLT